MDGKKTWITETNVGLVIAMVAWVGLQFGINMPGDVTMAIALGVIGVINIVLRSLAKNGII
jgi:membrane-bound ClpP family serine protease